MAMSFGAAAGVLSATGCLLYCLVLWLVFNPMERWYILMDQDIPAASKLIVPKILIYVSLPFAVAAVATGILSLHLEKRWKYVIRGFCSAGAALVLLLVFWLCTISRSATWYK
jgi:hypothetical protein